MRLDHAPRPDLDQPLDDRVGSNLHVSGENRLGVDHGCRMDQVRIRLAPSQVSFCSRAVAGTSSPLIGIGKVRIQNILEELVDSKKDSRSQACDAGRASRHATSIDLPGLDALDFCEAESRACRASSARELWGLDSEATACVGDRKLPSE